MQIKLDKGFILESDTNQFILKKDTNKFSATGRSEGPVLGFYSKIDQALIAYVEKAILCSEAKTLGHILSEIRDLRNYIRDIIRSL